MKELINSKSDWFQTWFDTPYYHLLYKNRDVKEAEYFIRKLTNKLKVQKSDYILDLACGKGRHAVFLNKLGYRVLGADLSLNSIAEAKKNESDDLKFIVHDMRDVITDSSFDFVFNLFTSFGYFDSEEDNIKVLNAVHSMLKPSGILLIDFMNTQKVIDNLPSHEEKMVDDITFKIGKRYDSKHIYKQIDFEDKGVIHSFTEKVQRIDLKTFQRCLSLTGFELSEIYGDYALGAFDEKQSDRLIIHARKS